MLECLSELNAFVILQREPFALVRGTHGFHHSPLFLSIAWTEPQHNWCAARTFSAILAGTFFSELSELRARSFVSSSGDGFAVRGLQPEVCL